MNDVLNENFCKKILLDIIKTNNLHISFMEKEELIDTIKNNFPKILANNLIEFIIDFNEKDQAYLDNKYAVKTQGHIITSLYSIDLNKAISLHIQDIFINYNILCKYKFTKNISIINKNIANSF